MTDLEFIKNFSKINISAICRELEIDRANLYNGKTSIDNEHKVKRAIEDKIARLYLIGEENVKKD